MKIQTNQIPEFVQYVSSTLEDAGFSAYLVGGCVRDLLIGRQPGDYDITTSALPEDMIKLFPKTVYENVFGTVLVVNEDEAGLTLIKGEVAQPVGVEVTPFRKEGKYTDRRHPDNVVFSKDINEDLSRRDFTINALAYRIQTDELVDLYDGKKDLESKIIRTVGTPDERLTEDPLRLMRAVRFAAQLGFAIESGTMNSVTKNADLLKHISVERIREEFVKIINSGSPAGGIEMLRRFNLLEHVIPELLDGVSCHQGGAHKYDVYEHLLHAVQHAADKKFSFEIRLAALFHDIGKPKTKRAPVPKGSADSKKISGPRVSSPDAEIILKPAAPGKPTFYGHEVVGARMAKKIMERMKFSGSEIDLVTKFVRYHMFFSDTDVITLSPVRRMIVNVGVDHIWELMQIRECDRVGMAKDEAPYRLRKYHAMIDQALRDPISPKQLKIDGVYLIKDLGIKPGPRMGWILHALLEEVIEDPIKNTVEYLSNRVRDLEKLNDADLKVLGLAGKEKVGDQEEEEIKELHKKHNVKK